jgi:hypothetical protein
MSPIHIQLTKVTRLPDRPDGDLYTLDNWQPITEGYTLKGTYLVAPKVGERFNVERHERNGVVALGDFSTSPVQSIVAEGSVTVLTTLNSVYHMRTLS